MDAIRSWLYIGKYQDTLDRPALTHAQIDAMLQLAERVEQPGIKVLFKPWRS